MSNRDEIIQIAIAEYETEVEYTKSTTRSLLR
jgi:hypothetical protein